MYNSDQALALAQAIAESADYQQGAVPADVLADLPEVFSQSVHVTNASRRIIESHMDGGDIGELLDFSWAIAREAGALRYYEEKVIFPIQITRGDGETPLEAYFRKGDPDRSGGKPWFLQFVNTYTPPVSTTNNAPSKEIEQFAWMGPWDDFLAKLADIALDETWDFGNPTPGEQRFTILKSYICTTFFRLKQEGKICISQDGDFAAFNTGLVDDRFDDIYLCFEPNTGNGVGAGSAWRFIGFAASGNRGLKKRVIAEFNPLPQTALYFDRIDDLLYDLNHELLPDYEHIILDNIDRLPLPFLEEEFRHHDEALELVRCVEEAENREKDRLYDQLRELVETDSRLYRGLRNRLEDAIDIAKRRVRWNFKTAIPSYYPRGNSMSLLLPLCLLDEQHADAALVVQLTDSGNYQGQTILTIEQAYTNARLICRPDSDWLTTQ